MKTRTKLPLRFVISRVGENSLMEYGASRLSLDSSETVYSFWNQVIATQHDYEPDKEHVVTIHLTAKFRPLGFHLVAIGSLSECTAHPREIFRPTILAAAYAFILCHNHPSGDPNPSGSDLLLTKRLSEAAQMLQIRFLDHVVIGAPAEGRKQPYYSFRDAGHL